MNESKADRISDKEKGKVRQWLPGETHADCHAFITEGMDISFHFWLLLSNMLTFDETSLFFFSFVLSSLDDDELGPLKSARLPS